MKILATRASKVPRHPDGDVVVNYAVYLGRKGLLRGWCLHCNNVIDYVTYDRVTYWMHLGSMQHLCRDGQTAAEPVRYMIAEEW